MAYGFLSGAAGQAISQQLQKPLNPPSSFGMDDLLELGLKYGPDIALAAYKKKYYEAASASELAQKGKFDAEATAKNSETAGRVGASTQVEDPLLANLIQSGATGDQIGKITDRVDLLKKRDAGKAYVGYLQKANPQAFGTVGGDENLADNLTALTEGDPSKIENTATMLKKFSDEGILNSSMDDAMKFAQIVGGQEPNQIIADKLAMTKGATPGDLQEQRFNAAFKYLKDKNPQLYAVFAHDYLTGGPEKINKRFLETQKTISETEENKASGRLSDRSSSVAEKRGVLLGEQAQTEPVDRELKKAQTLKAQKEAEKKNQDDTVKTVKTYQKDIDQYEAEAKDLREEAQKVLTTTSRKKEIQNRLSELDRLKQGARSAIDQLRGSQPAPEAGGLSPVGAQVLQTLDRLKTLNSSGGNK